MKNVLITGVGGGMGHATAKLLAEQGYNVFGIDVKPDCDLPINYFCANLCNAQEVEQVFAQVSSLADNLFAILHFAGKYVMDSLVEISQEEFVNVFDVNLFSVYRVNKTFLPLLAKGSRVVVTSSELAPLDPLPFTGLYAVTKSAIEKYAYSLRMELNLLGIKVSVIRPGAVNTGMIGASVTSLEKLCDKTVLYKENTTKFRHIVESVETKKIPPQRIAKIAKKILQAKRPKYVYNVNRNAGLRLLNLLPQKMQVRLITKLLKKSPQKGKQNEQTNNLSQKDSDNGCK